MDCKYCDSSDVDYYSEDEQPCYRCNDCGESWESLGRELRREEMRNEQNLKEKKK